MTDPRSQLLEIYREQMFPFAEPSDAALIRWCERIELLADLRISWFRWSSDRAQVLVGTVHGLFDQWRATMPTWVVERACQDGTELTRHIQAPTYELAQQLWD